MPTSIPTAHYSIRSNGSLLDFAVCGAPTILNGVTVRKNSPVTCFQMCRSCRNGYQIDAVSTAQPPKRTQLSRLLRVCSASSRLLRRGVFVGTQTLPRAATTTMFNGPAALLLPLFLHLASADSSYFQSSEYTSGALGLSPVQSYYSSSLTPPEVNFLTNVTSEASTNYTMLTFRGTAAKQPAPMILDNAGDLVWSGSTFGQSMDLTTQELFGEKVLTFFNGSFYSAGYGLGQWMIIGSNYSVIRSVSMPNQTFGTSDFHEFVITKNNTALLESWVVVETDLSSVGGNSTGWTFDCRFAEMDLATNETLFQWSGLEHGVSVDESYFTISDNAGSSEDNPWDYCHINSLEKDNVGNYLVSMRGPSTLYYISGSTGDILWRLSGKNTNFTMGTNSTFWYQHDARFLTDNTVSPFNISLFDNANGGSTDAEPTARALILSVDTTAMTVTLMEEYLPSFGTTSASQGSTTVMANGNVFVGWGATPVYTEYTHDGTIVQDVRFGYNSTVQSYRAFKQSWTGYPLTSPDFALNSTGTLTAYASWNGATEVATWSLMGGNSTSGMASISNTTRSGFETEMTVKGSYTYLSAAALSSNGTCLGTTKVWTVSSQESTGTSGDCPSGGSSSSTTTSRKSAGTSLRFPTAALTVVAAVFVTLI
ncbi:hypothetical protein T439DRAFT_188133 [Meredithblackwellia eburnea MCA 4105]